MTQPWLSGQRHPLAAKSETSGLVRGCPTAVSCRLRFRVERRELCILLCPTSLEDSRTKIAPSPFGLVELKISLNLRGS